MGFEQPAVIAIYCLLLLQIERLKELVAAGGLAPGPIYSTLHDAIYLVDVVWATFGYMLSCTLFDSHIRSVEPTILGGWWVGGWVLGGGAVLGACCNDSDRWPYITALRRGRDYLFVACYASYSYVSTHYPCTHLVSAKHQHHTPGGALHLLLLLRVCAAGWAAALVCYQPFNASVVDAYFTYGGPSNNWQDYLADAPNWCKALWGGSVLLLISVYTWSTVVFGLRFSNLTNRVSLDAVLGSRGRGVRSVLVFFCSVVMIWRCLKA